MITVNTGDTYGQGPQVDRDDRNQGSDGCPGDSRVRIRVPDPDGAARCAEPGYVYHWFAAPDDPGLPFYPVDPIRVRVPDPRAFRVRCLGDSDYADIAVAGLWALLVTLLVAGFILAVLTLPGAPHG